MRIKFTPQTILLLLCAVFVIGFFVSKRTEITLPKASGPTYTSDPAFSVNLSGGPVAEGQKQVLEAQAGAVDQQTQDNAAASDQQLLQNQQNYNQTQPAINESKVAFIKFATVFCKVGAIVTGVLAIPLVWIVFLVSIIIWITKPKIVQKGDIYAAFSLLTPKYWALGTILDVSAVFQVGPGGIERKGLTDVGSIGKLIDGVKQVLSARASRFRVDWRPSDDHWDLGRNKRGKVLDGQWRNADQNQPLVKKE